MLALIGGALLLAAAMRLLNPLPPLRLRIETRALTGTENTRLGCAAAPLFVCHPGLTGVYLLDDALEAFAARLHLVRRAERSLDLQYYIWRCDVSGLLLLDALRAAADRGVRVRMLLDDNGVAGLDEILAAFDRHANLEVRLFNPFVIRRPKAIGYLLDFPRLNRRMHNKCFIADNQAMIVGGRNVGDEYFDAAHDASFVDLDAFGIGGTVSDVSCDFDRYWASASAYPAHLILPSPPPGRLAALHREVAAVQQSPLARRYAEAERSSIVTELVAGRLPLEWAVVTVMSDDPAKAFGKLDDTALLGPRLAAAIGQPKSHLGIVSAYFVLTAAGTRAFAAMAAACADLQVMTNSVWASSHVMIHTGYAQCRRPLLVAGIRLWEMKPRDPHHKARLKFGKQRSGVKSGTILRSSGSALHAKAFTVDRQRLFVGSFNFDPRSLRLNTEMGLIIDSPVLAGRLQDMFCNTAADIAYEVRLAGRRLEWIEHTEAGEMVHRHEPGTGPLQRLVLAMLSHVPVKWLL
ncbi:MAG: phospholipase D family protein [Acetobacteraceae bacterium]|nr:phospholipase D family protein [Acetobacteraceae bacterium]